MCQKYLKLEGQMQGGRFAFTIYFWFLTASVYPHKICISLKKKEKPVFNSTDISVAKNVLIMSLSLQILIMLV